MNYDYPNPDNIRNGSKVSWYLYANIEDAERAAVLARQEAAGLRERGYDFGYQMPGSIKKIDEVYEVTIP